MKRILALTLILGGYAVGQGAKAPQLPKAPESSHAGRYQIFFSPPARADVYLLDTETGQIWRPVTITNAKDRNLKSTSVEIWLYQDRIDSEAAFDAWMLLHQPPPAPGTSPQ